MIGSKHGQIISTLYWWMIAANILFFIAMVNINGLTRLFRLSEIEQIYHTCYLVIKDVTSTFMLAKLHTHYYCCLEKKSSEDDQSDQNEWILLFLHNSTTEKTFCWNVNSRLSLLRISDLYPFVQSEDFINQFHFWLFFLGLENLLCLTSRDFFFQQQQ